MEGKPPHLLLPHPRLPFLAPAPLPNHRLPRPSLRLSLHHRKPKAKQLAFSRPPNSQSDTPGRGGWEWARSASAAAALALHLAACSLLILFPTPARACAQPPPPAAVEAKEQEEGDEEWEAALQQWKSKTYALSVPLRVVALRGSFPPAWIKDFVEAQGKRLKFSPEFRPSIDTLFSELSKCVDKGQVQPKSAMAADVVSIGDSWLGYAVRKGLVEPISNAEEQDWYRSLSDRWKEPEWRGRF